MPNHKELRVPLERSHFWDTQRQGSSPNPTGSRGKSCRQLHIIGQNRRAKHLRSPEPNLAVLAPALSPRAPPPHPITFWPRGKRQEIASIFHKQKAKPTARSNPTHKREAFYSGQAGPLHFFFPSFPPPRWRNKRKFVAEAQTFLGPCPSSTLFFFSFLSAPHPHPTFPASPP